MKLRTLLLWLCVTALSAPASSAIVYAADFELTMFGSSVIVLGEYPERKLQINGRVVLTNAIVTFSEVMSVNGIPALIGESSNGGNACDASPFIISFPTAGAPRLDGPLDVCAEVKYERKANHIEFWTTAIPGAAGERWSWTPENGLKKLASVSFSADKTVGWIKLRERSIEHPLDILKIGEIASQIEILLGPDKLAYEGIIAGVGSGEFKGDDYVGKSCTPHMCGEEEAIIFASSSEKKVFLAWKPSNQKISVRPPLKKWPEKARRELKNWANNWK